VKLFKIRFNKINKLKISKNVIETLIIDEKSLLRDNT